MIASSLPAALRTGADGLHTLEAAAASTSCSDPSASVSATTPAPAITEHSKHARKPEITHHTRRVAQRPSPRSARSPPHDFRLLTPAKPRRMSAWRCQQHVTLMQGGCSRPPGQVLSCPILRSPSVCAGSHPVVLHSYLAVILIGASSSERSNWSC
jgi:hypothetical protein